MYLLLLPIVFAAELGGDVLVGMVLSSLSFLSLSLSRPFPSIRLELLLVLYLMLTDVFLSFNFEFCKTTSQQNKGEY